MTKIFLLLLFIPVILKTENPESTGLLNTAAGAGYLSPLEKEIICEINLFRSNPAKYAEKYIAPLARNFNKNILTYPGDLPIKTVEGVSALNECVRDLKRINPLPLVYPNVVLSLSAEDHCHDQSKSGATGHIGSDQSNLRTRIERHGKWEKQIAENIAYGNTSARQTIIFLLIDDNVRSRGHRKTFLNPNLKLAGVACGSHPEYRTMCVIDFAAGMAAK